MRKGRNRFLMALAAAILIAGHGVMLHYVSSHWALSMGAVAGVAVLVAVKYLGWFVGRKLWHQPWRRHPPGR